MMEPGEKEFGLVDNWFSDVGDRLAMVRAGYATVDIINVSFAGGEERGIVARLGGLDSPLLGDSRRSGGGRLS